MRRLMLGALAGALVLAAGCGEGDDSGGTNPQGQAPTSAQGVRPSQSVTAGSTAPGAAPTGPQALSDGNAPGIPPLTGEIKTENGVRYIDELVGTGAALEQGQTALVHYTGWLTSGGQPFDSSIPRNQPYPVEIGGGGVIPGWQAGLASMNVGGKRRLIIPPELAYGAAGRPPIPPAATLIFDVEVVSAE